MMFENNEGRDFESFPDKDGINQSSSESVRDIAERARESLRDSAWSALKYFWSEDLADKKRIEEAGYPEDAVNMFYVMDDDFSVTEVVTTEDGSDTTRTLSLKLIPQDESELDYSESLDIYVPVPGDTRMHDQDFDIETLSAPKVVFVRRKWADGKVEGYRIDRIGVTTYRGVDDVPSPSAADAPEELDVNLWTTFNKRIDSGLPVITRLQEDMINMKTIKQRMRPTHSPESFDF